MTVEQRKEDVQPPQRLCLGSPRGNGRTAGGSVCRMGWLCFLVTVYRTFHRDGVYGFGVCGFEFRALGILGSVFVV